MLIETFRWPDLILLISNLLKPLYVLAAQSFLHCYVGH